MDQNAPKKQQHTAKRVHDRLKELYPEEFTADERSVRKFVAGLCSELKLNSRGFIPFEHPPREAQVDLGEARFIENNRTYDGYYLNISYQHSNEGHTQLFKSANQECLLQGMKDIGLFGELTGLPKESKDEKGEKEPASGRAEKGLIKVLHALSSVFNVFKGVYNKIAGGVGKILGQPAQGLMKPLPRPIIKSTY